MWSACQQHPREKTWRTLKALHKGSGFPGEEKEALAYRKDAVTIGSIRTGGGATQRTWVLSDWGRGRPIQSARGASCPVKRTIQ